METGRCRLTKMNEVDFDCGCLDSGECESGSRSAIGDYARVSIESMRMNYGRRGPNENCES